MHKVTRFRRQSQETRRFSLFERQTQPQRPQSPVIVALSPCISQALTYRVVARILSEQHYGVLLYSS